MGGFVFVIRDFGIVVLVVSELLSGLVTENTYSTNCRVVFVKFNFINEV